MDTPKHSSVEIPVASEDKKRRFGSAERTRVGAGVTTKSCCTPCADTPSTKSPGTPWGCDSLESDGGALGLSTPNSEHVAASPATAGAVDGVVADGSPTVKGTGAAPRKWAPDSWRGLFAAQNPFSTLRPGAFSPVYRQLSSLPSLISASEVSSLLSFLSLAQKGEAFLLQGGPCAERFCCCREETLRETAGLLLQLGALIEEQLNMPVCVMGRIAGQYGKPRTNNMEQQDGRAVLTYRGDAVNSEDPNDRTPNPKRLLAAYFHSAATLNFLRRFLAECHAGSSVWEPGPSLSAQRREQFSSIFKARKERMQIRMLREDRAPQASPTASEALPEEIDRHTHTKTRFLSTQTMPHMYTSHEAILLPYEEALTRRMPFSSQALAGSAHFLWIGDRTRQLDSAHVEFCRGLMNPIGLKVGPSADPEEVVALCERLNPQNQPGKLTLITRLGAALVSAKLPPIVDAIKAAGAVVLWVCDPMHGNTTLNPQDEKQRNFRDIVNEINCVAHILAQKGEKLGGLHLELTGENILECHGGPLNPGGPPLTLPFCDPLLNYQQSLEIAFELGSLLSVPADSLPNSLGESIRG